jgi:hypothetical protein
MSTKLPTEEDFLFFEYLAPFRWQSPEDRRKIKFYRELVSTGELQIESLLENALVQCSGGVYTRVCENTHDHSDGSDAKKVVSTHRCNDYANDQWTNSWNVQKVAGKIGLLRILAYSKQTRKFHHFAIPRCAYKGLKKNLEIGLDRSTGYREPLGVPGGKWMIYEVPDFNTLAKVTEQTQVEKYLKNKAIYG